MGSNPTAPTASEAKKFIPILNNNNMMEKPSQPEQEFKVLLSFEKFTSRMFPDNPEDRMPKYGNFVLYFSTGNIAESFRKNEHYLKFEKEHFDLADKLKVGIGNIKSDENYFRNLKQFEEDLYEAYRIMRGYGAVDQQLFS